MADDPRVEEWRTRAKDVVHSTTAPFNQLIQALPRLQLLGQGFRMATERYALNFGSMEDRFALAEIEYLAGRRVSLMKRRYLVTKSQVGVEKTLGSINFQIMLAQTAVCLGKLAELYLGLGKYLGECEDILEEAKTWVDTAKTSAGIAGASNSEQEEIAALQLSSLFLSGLKETKNLSKIIWDIASTARRMAGAQGKFDFDLLMQKVALLANGLKAIIDQFAALSEYCARNPTFLKNAGKALGAFRDAADALRAYVRAVSALIDMHRNFKSAQRQLEEGRRYLGVEREILSAPLVPWRFMDARTVVAGARDVATAERLAVDAKREAERILAGIRAAEDTYFSHLIRVIVALRDVQPDLAATEEGLDRMSDQILNLSWAMDKKDQSAVQARLIHDNLVGFRAVVNSTYTAVQSLLLPLREAAEATSH